MTLEQLRIFVAVAERQHVTRAAEALHLAQSAASAAIAALEGRHGAKLFSRVGRGIELTEAGRVFLDEARAVLARAEAAELKLAELAGLKRGRLLVQASQTIASYWLPRHLVDFRRAHPGIEIRLAVGNTAEAVAAVLAGTVELGFVEGPVDTPSLEVTEVARDKLVVVVAADHPWAEKTAMTARDLAEGEWVMREPGSGTRVVFEDALRALGVAVPPPQHRAGTADQRGGARGGGGRHGRDGDLRFRRRRRPGGRASRPGPHRPAGPALHRRPPRRAPPEPRGGRADRHGHRRRSSLTRDRVAASYEASNGEAREPMAGASGRRLENRRCTVT